MGESVSVLDQASPLEPSSPKKKTFNDQIIDNLPLSFDLQAVERTNEAGCELCQKPFT